MFGRSVASAAGYDYSPALQRLDGSWTEERLDTFLTDPVSLAPGTKMAIEGIEDSDSRRLIISFLKASY